jgi:cobalt-zinc-cadmium efflux system protein
MSHGHPTREGSRHWKPLVFALVLVSVFMVVEIVAAVLTGSLALLSDAGHMATDALGIGMALAAILAANRMSREGGRTFGVYRLEILAALANAVLLFAVSGYVIWEALSRLSDPPSVEAVPMLVVAIAGLGVNVAAWLLLREGARESLNVRGAYLEVLGDLVGSVGVIIAGVVTLTTGWAYADALVAGLVGVLIVPRAARLGAQATRVLIQAAPPGVDLGVMRADLVGIDGVTEVHDLHVWTLTSAMEVASAHITTESDVASDTVLDDARWVLEDRYGITHATLQIETAGRREPCEIAW